MALIDHSPEMEIVVLWKRQLDKAIEWLIENDIQFQWVPENLLQPNEQFKLVVYGLVWTHNIIDFANVLKTCDYQDLE